MHDATAATETTTATERDDANHVPLILRHDTIVGVCEAIGRDFGFNPNFLRVAVGSVVLFNPLLAVSIYAALGVAVLLSRWLFPARRIELSAEAETLAAEAPANDGSRADAVALAA